MYDEFNKVLDLALSGNVEAVEDILERLKPLILAQIKRYYNKNHDYDDLISQGHLVILECLKNFDRSRGVKFLGYVKCQLMYSYLGNHNEKHHFSLNTPISHDGEDEKIDLLESKDNSPLDVFLIWETHQDLYHALSSLTKRQREVITLFYIDGMSIPEVAEELGIAYRTVVNTKTYALDKLKVKLKNKSI